MKGESFHVYSLEDSILLRYYLKIIDKNTLSQKINIPMDGQLLQHHLLKRESFLY